MPEHHEKTGEKKSDWLKIEFSAPGDLIDALTNFVTEIGAKGAFQESLEPQSPNDFPEALAGETLKAFLPFDVRLEQRLASLQTYIDSLAEIFPKLEKPTFRTEVIRDPNWGEAWKKYFKPLRVSRNIVIKPTWERFAPTGRDIVIEIDPGMAFGTGQHASTRMCLEAIEEIFLKDRTFEKWRVLDVGTGTGILGIACAKLDAKRVLCVDIDQKATEIARENVLINQVGTVLRSLTGTSPLLRSLFT
jgi:ribosomal protein L11 methyltransferase